MKIKKSLPRIYELVFVLLVAFVFVSSNIVVASAEALRIKEPSAVNVEVMGEVIDLETLKVESISGNVKITDTIEDAVDITTSLKISPTNFFTIENAGAQVIWESVLLPNGLKVLTDINIDDYRNGLFISISVRRNGDGWLHLATGTETRQYDLVGGISNPLSLKPSEERVALASSVRGEEVELVPGIFVKPLPIRSGSGIVHVFPAKEERVTTHTSITAYSRGIQPSARIGIERPKFYGLVHEVFFDDVQSVPEQLPNWWRTYTAIDYGVYVEEPSEARIKYDLQKYNKLVKGSDSRSKELWAYNIDTHGSTVDEPDKPLLGSDYSWLFPGEVEDLWYEDSNYIVRPWGTIILADACYSLWDSDESSGGEMAEAWVDYGASAYVGSTFLVPADADDFLEEFWRSLCQENENVGKAESDASTAMGFGATDFQVYGDSSETLPG